VIRGDTPLISPVTPAGIRCMAISMYMGIEYCGYNRLIINYIKIFCKIVKKIFGYIS
jgi:hypothetical protein